MCMKKVAWKKLTVSISVILITLFLSNIIHAQSTKEVQNNLSKYIQQLDDLSNGSFKKRYDSLNAVNKETLSYLKKACTNNNNLLDSNISFQGHNTMTILTSTDHLFRIFCWDVMHNGTAHSYNSVIQFKSGNTTKAIILNDASQAVEGVISSGEFYTDLYTIHTKDHRTIYLLKGFMILATGLGENEISAYSIEKENLNNNYPFFKAATKTLNSISFEYDLSTLQNRDYNSSPDIKVSADNTQIKIPLIKKNSKITSNYLVYKFNGYQFVFDKDAKQE